MINKVISIITNTKKASCAFNNTRITSYNVCYTKLLRRLTNSGRQLSRIPLDPRLARMVLAAPQFDCLEEVLIITSALSIQDPRERPLDKQQASDEAHRRFEDKDSDFTAFLNLWRYVQEQQDALSQNQFRKQCQKDYLSYLRLREWQDIHYQSYNFV